ncbi:alkaline phosphatase PafA [Aurantibacter sp.]|uniref:alkaline phosphatase PafA n=1 Tax=Aurantibacter sp. TaxID=2807103 RepID=UPI0035C86B4E
MKKIGVFLVFLIAFSCVSVKNPDIIVVNKSPTKKQETSRPKLVIGIVVDQMRYDYLTRFYSKYGNGGFKRLMNNGFNFKNNHYNYVPTYTGPGHASVFTGATPKTHAIIGNNWYDKYEDKYVYCTGDKNVLPVGTLNKAGLMSPHRMKTTTLGDENRLFTQFKGKTIGISIKDRGAILPAGHSANAAYWFHGAKEGAFVSSSYYMTDLPQWVKDFNQSNTAESYLKEWNTLYPIESYTESGVDKNDFETGFKDQNFFPYNLNELKNLEKPFDIIKATPYGNSLVTDFAIEVVKNEALGKDEYTDVLTVSFSSTDYVGHNFGVNSKEVEDTYIRLDKDIERFLNYIDTEIGNENYTLFLTSDHGAIDVPSYLKTKQIPAGYTDKSKIRKKLDLFLKTKYTATGLIKKISNNQVFLDKEIIDLNKLNKAEIEEVIVDEIITYNTIYKAYGSKTLQTTNFTTGLEYLVQNGFNQKYSGDVVFVYNPNYISYNKTGSTHGSGFNYDTHVPLLFYGNGIQKGETFNKTEITSIVPTISALLGVSFPNGSSDKVLSEALKN